MAQLIEKTNGGIGMGKESIEKTRLLIGLDSVVKCEKFLNAHFNMSLEQIDGEYHVLDNEIGESNFQSSNQEELEDYCTELWITLKSNGLSPIAIQEVEKNKVHRCYDCESYTLNKQTFSGKIYCKECQNSLIECAPEFEI